MPKLALSTYPDLTRLSSDQIASLAKELTPLAGKGFTRCDPISDDLLSDVTSHLKNSTRLLIARSPTHEILAFLIGSTKKLGKMKFYHVVGIVVDPSLQGLGLGTQLLQTELLTTQVQAIILRTQSRRMQALAAKVADLDPVLARAAAPTFYPTNLDGCINRGVYCSGSSLYGDEKIFAQDAIEEINWRSGDALIIAGRIKRTIGPTLP